MSSLEGKKLIWAAYLAVWLSATGSMPPRGLQTKRYNPWPVFSFLLCTSAIDGWYSSFEEFEQAAKDCTHSTDRLLAVSYSRASLGQTGSGHFSPVGGYTSLKGGMVLVLDVARFKCGVHRASRAPGGC